MSTQQKRTDDIKKDSKNKGNEEGMKDIRRGIKKRHNKKEERMTQTEQTTEHRRNNIGTTQERTKTHN